MIKVGANAQSVTLDPERVRSLIANCFHGGEDGELGVCEAAWMMLQRLGEDAGLEFVAEEGINVPFESIEGRYYMPTRDMMFRRAHKARQRDNPPLPENSS